MKRIIENCVLRIMKENPNENAMGIDREFNKVLKEFIKDKNVDYGVPDEALTGKYLEWKINEIFKEMGANLTTEETAIAHDGIIVYHGLKDKDLILKFVLEIKSHKKHGAIIDDLRELDDWVFCVSGEEKARKERIYVCEAHWILGQPAEAGGYFQHPDPHKGVLILNHDTKNKVDDRCVPFGPSAIAFAETRNFCLIDFPTFLSLYERWRKNLCSLGGILTAIYKSVGAFEMPAETSA